jgi:hypothetical protein
MQIMTCAAHRILWHLKRARRWFGLRSDKPRRNSKLRDVMMLDALAGHNLQSISTSPRPEQVLAFSPPMKEAINRVLESYGINIVKQTLH